MEEILKIIDLKLRVAYGTGYSDCENIGTGMDEDEYMSEISLYDIQEAIKQYTTECIKASLSKALKTPLLIMIKNMTHLL